MLIGHYFQKFSNKGRVALPSKFKKELGRKVILTRWYESSLAIFSLTFWNEVVKQVTGGSVVTRPARDTERFLLGGAYEIEPDKQGRFVVPKALRNFAKMTDEVAFVGLANRVEIWDKKIWEKREQEIIKHAEGLIEEVQQKRQGK